MSNILVIGGLGFIGHHISKELSRDGMVVTIAQRSISTNRSSPYPVITLDLQSISKEALSEVLSGFQAVIFCGGADDRTMPTGDAETFYYRENVVPCLMLVAAAKKSGVQKIVILGSYLSHFDRTIPAWNLKEKHPYIRSRHLQQTETVALADSSLQVTTVEIPYVFGAAPGKIPLWTPLINYIDRMPVVFYTKGGTNIMSVQQVAQAVLGVVNATTYQPHWLIGSENVSWTKLIQMISTALGKKRLVILLSTRLVRAMAWLAKLYFWLSKKQTGLDPVHYVDVQTSNTFLDVEESMLALGYHLSDMQVAIEETVKACEVGE